MIEHQKNQVINATKWSTISEIVAKIVSPVTNMILARILAPEAFGVIATVTMIISFADMLTDSGFHKYLIQHEFHDENEKYRNANVAFWTNFVISVFIWCIIIMLREPIALLVGNPGKGNVLAIACFQLLLTAFSSIQMALFRRDFDYKTIFITRAFSICVPFVVTVPLALLGFSYWALVIGSISIQLSNAVILTIKSKWKPSLYYSLKILKQMFSFSMWSLVEAISIWLTGWADVFIIGTVFNEYYLGLYKTSTSMVNSIMALITSSTVSVLFSTLSRLQDNENQFNYMFLKFQKFVSVFMFPIGIGIYLYSDLVTKMLLGSQWSEASDMIGVWALTTAIGIIFGHYNSEVYRAKGRPKLSFMAQVLHLIALIPACIISAKFGFLALVYTRTLIKLEGVIVQLFIMKIAIGIKISTIFKNILPSLTSTVLMGLFGVLLQQIQEGILWDIASIILCALFYFGILFLFPQMRKELFSLAKRIIPQTFIEKYQSINNKE